MDREAWHAAIHGVAKSWTRLSGWTDLNFYLRSLYLTASLSYWCFSAAKSCSTLCNPMDCRLSCPLSSPRSCSNSCPLSQWYHPTISSSVISFFSCLQSFPASGSFPVILLFTSGGQSTGASASASVLPMNVEGWFPLQLTGFISLWSKGCSRVFSSTTVLKHLFGIQPPLWFSYHISTWLLEKPCFDYMDLCQQNNVSAF